MNVVERSKKTRDFHFGYEKCKLSYAQKHGLVGWRRSINGECQNSLSCMLRSGFSIILTMSVVSGAKFKRGKLGEHEESTHESTYKVSHLKKFQSLVCAMMML